MLEEKKLSPSLSVPILSLVSFVCVCVCVCVLLAASILNVVDGSLKLKKGSLNSGPIEFFLWKKNTIVES